jgi:hypothetical protein
MQCTSGYVADVRYLALMWGKDLSGRRYRCSIAVDLILAGSDITTKPTNQPIAHPFRPRNLEELPSERDLQHHKLR